MGPFLESPMPSREMKMQAEGKARHWVLIFCGHTRAPTWQPLSGSLCLGLPASPGSPDPSVAWRSQGWHSQSLSTELGQGEACGRGSSCEYREHDPTTPLCSLTYTDPPGTQRGGVGIKGEEPHFRAGKQMEQTQGHSSSASTARAWTTAEQRRRWQALWPQADSYHWSWILALLAFRDRCVPCW